MRILLAQCLLLAATTATAQSTLPRDEGARIERVADDVYVIVHDDASDEWPHANTGIVVGDRGVLVIDTPYLPSRTRADIALLRELTPLPVTHLVYTHWHMDHNNGAADYKRAFPQLVIVSEANTARWAPLNQRWYARMSSAPDSARRKAIDEMRGDAGKARIVAQRDAELVELAALEIVVPDLRFEGTLSLPFEDAAVELVDRGPGNSPHDVTVWLPRQRVLFAGDLLVQAPLPFTGASWPVTWAAVLRDLEAIDAAAIVPGHGPVLRDHAYTRAVRALIDAVLVGVEHALAEGWTLEQAQARIDLSHVRATMPAWRDAALDADFRTVTSVLIERAWRGVRGQG
jgi:cyclase